MLIRLGRQGRGMGKASSCLDGCLGVLDGGLRKDLLESGTVKEWSGNHNGVSGLSTNGTFQAMARVDKAKALVDMGSCKTVLRVKPNAQQRLPTQ